MGLNLILSQGGLLIYGSQQRGLPQIFPGSLHFLGVDLTVAKLVLIVSSVVVTVALFTVYEKTRVGRAMRAVAFNPQAAGLQGVSVRRVYLITFGVATGLAGVAGAILAPSYGMNPSMGFNVLWTVFLMTMLGGADSLLGALAGGLVIGQILSFGQYYVGGIVQVILFVLIGFVLYIRPQGLLGRGVDIGM
jgi:branched-chain amino acid transport system permease protein